jgi:hypothetical protein
MKTFLTLCDDKEAAIEKFKLLARTKTIRESQVVELTNAGVVSIYKNKDYDYSLDVLVID